MYEPLTELISTLENGAYGTWKGGERNEAGVIEFPYVSYSGAVNRLIQRVNDFDISGIGLSYSTYRDRLEELGLASNRRNADVSKLDGPDVFALLLYVVRANSFGEGLLMKYLEEGAITRWLRRLQEIDERMHAYTRLATVLQLHIRKQTP